MAPARREIISKVIIKEAGTYQPTDRAMAIDNPWNDTVADLKGLLTVRLDESDGQVEGVTMVTNDGEKTFPYDTPWTAFREAMGLGESDRFWYAQLNEDNIAPDGIEATITCEGDYLQFLDRAKAMNGRVWGNKDEQIDRSSSLADEPESVNLIG